jgi:hypothetical protein
MGTGGSFRGVKRLGLQADHSPPSGAGVNAWSYTSTPLYVLMALWLVKHKDDFTVYTCLSFCFAVQKIWNATYRYNFF